MGGGIDLERLAAVLRQRHADADPPLRVRVTNAGRQLVAVPDVHAAAPATDGLKRSARPAPPGGSFELYVMVQDPAEAAADARVMPPPQPGGLHLDPDSRTQMWVLPGPGEDRVVVRFRRGPAMADAAAQDLLRAVEEAVR